MIIFLEELVKYLMHNNVQFNIYGYPIFDDSMILPQVPVHLLPYSNRKAAVLKKNTVLCFYLNDYRLLPKLSMKKLFEMLDEVKEYMGICGFDISVFIDDMKPYAEAKILLNMCITCFFAINGVKIIPNIRYSNLQMTNMIYSYPKYSIISMGFRGFGKNKDNNINESIIMTVNNYLQPSIILIYGTLNLYLTSICEKNNIKIIMYPAYRDLVKALPKKQSLVRSIYG